MMKQTKFWIIAFAVLAALCLGGFFLLRGGGHAGSTAEIWQDGVLIETIDLDAVTIPYDFEVSGQYGRNTVHVEHGAISVTDSDCPDGLCVQQGAISDGYIPIICMPHRLVIEIEAEP